MTMKTSHTTQPTADQKRPFTPTEQAFINKISPLLWELWQGFPISLERVQEIYQNKEARRSFDRHLSYLEAEGLVVDVQFGGERRKKFFTLNQEKTFVTLQDFIQAALPELAQKSHESQESLGARKTAEAQGSQESHESQDTRKGAGVSREPEVSAARLEQLVDDCIQNLQQLALIHLNDASFGQQLALRCGIAKLGQVLTDQELASHVHQQLAAEVPFASTLQEAIANQQALSISYEKYQGDLLSYTLMPWGLYTYRHKAQYLVALKLTPDLQPADEQPHVFRVSRIKKLEVLSEQRMPEGTILPLPPADFLPEDYIKLPYQYGAGPLHTTTFFVPAASVDELRKHVYGQGSFDPLPHKKTAELTFPSTEGVLWTTEYKSAGRCARFALEFGLIPALNDEVSACWQSYVGEEW